MKNWLTRILTISVSAALVLSVASQANAARKAGLLDSNLIKDATDVRVFPQSAVDYRNLVRFDLQGHETSSGLLLFGDDATTYGVTTTAGAGANLVNAIYAAGDLGVSLGVEMGGESSTPDGGDETGTSGMGVTLGVGYDMGDMEIGAGLVFANSSDVVGGEDGPSSSALGIGAVARSFADSGEGTQLGWFAGFGFASGSDTVGDDTSSDSAITLGAGYGPVYTTDKGTVAAYGSLDVETTSTTPAEGDGDSTMTITPGFHIAAEVWISDSLVARGATSYGWDMASGTDAAKTATSSKSSSYAWSTGLGWKAGNLQVDGVLGEGFLSNGPHFVSGAEGALFTQVSASYSF